MGFYKDTIIHEFGHYLYRRGKGSFTTEEIQALSHCQQILLTVNPSCYNDDETFAEMYKYWKENMLDGYISWKPELSVLVTLFQKTENKVIVIGSAGITEPVPW